MDRRLNIAESVVNKLQYISLLSLETKDGAMRLLTYTVVYCHCGNGNSI